MEDLEHLLPLLVVAEPSPFLLHQYNKAVNVPPLSSNRKDEAKLNEESLPLLGCTGQ